MIRRLIISLTVLFILATITLQAQSFRVEDMKNLFGKGNPLKFSGGFSANSVTNAGYQLNYIKYDKSRQLRTNCDIKNKG